MWVKAFLLKCFWKGSAIGLEAYAKTRPKVYIFLLNYLIDNLFTINSQDGTFGINFKKDRRRSCQNFQIFEVSNLKKHALLTIRMCYKIGHSSRLSSIQKSKIAVEFLINFHFHFIEKLLLYCWKNSFLFFPYKNSRYSWKTFSLFYLFTV